MADLPTEPTPSSAPGVTATAGVQPGTDLFDDRCRAVRTAFYETVRTEHDRLDVLVHTAGVVPYEQEVTEEGIERSFAVNYLSRFLLTSLLEDRLRAGGLLAVAVLVGALGSHVSAGDGPGETVPAAVLLVLAAAVTWNRTGVLV